MSKPQITWQGATLTPEILLPGLMPMALNVLYVSPLFPRIGFNTLWGWIAADQPFHVLVVLQNRAGMNGTGTPMTSDIDPVTGFFTVNFANLALPCARFGLIIQMLGMLPMTFVGYHLEVHP
jgi:hypothetical protein